MRNSTESMVLERLSDGLGFIDVKDARVRSFTLSTILYHRRTIINTTSARGQYAGG